MGTSWEGLGTRLHKHRTGNSCKVNLHVLKELQQLLKRHELNLQGQNRDDDSMGRSRSVAIIPLTFEVSPSFLVNFTVHHMEVFFSLFDLVFKI